MPLSYDDMGRLESKSDPDTGTFGYDYNQSGNRTSVSTPSGSVTYICDDLTRLETVADPATDTARYSYDTVGKLKTVSDPNGTRAEYIYDLLKRLTLLENRGSDGKGKVTKVLSALKLKVEVRKFPPLFALHVSSLLSAGGNGKNKGWRNQWVWFRESFGCMLISGIHWCREERELSAFRASM